MKHIELVHEDGRKEQSVMSHDTAEQFEQIMETVAPIALEKGRLIKRDIEPRDNTVDGYTIEEWDESGAFSQENARLCQLCAKQLQSIGYVIHENSPAAGAFSGVFPCDGILYGLNCELSNPVAA